MERRRSSRLTARALALCPPLPVLRPRVGRTRTQLNEQSPTGQQHLHPITRRQRRIAVAPQQNDQLLTTNNNELPVSRRRRQTAFAPRLNEQSRTVRQNRLPVSRRRRRTLVTPQQNDQSNNNELPVSRRRRQSTVVPTPNEYEQILRGFDWNLEEVGPSDAGFFEYVALPILKRSFIVDYNLRSAKFSAELQAAHKVDSICTICFEEFTTEDDVTILSCEHIFHLACVKRWVDREHTCPVCRKGLIENLSMKPATRPSPIYQPPLN